MTEFGRFISGDAEYPIIWALLSLVIAGVIFALAATYARRHGHLKSAPARYTAVGVILVIALLIFLGPYLQR